MTPVWLDRNLVATPIDYTLCTTEAMYLAEVQRLQIPYPTPWVGKTGDACTHHFDRTDGRRACSIVCIRVRPDQVPIGIAALLVHEAVHLWQEYVDLVGETNESREFEAYSIQWLSSELMHEFARQTLA